MNQVVATKSGANGTRWEGAMRDKAFDLIRSRIIVETRGEHILAVLRKGTVSTNVYFQKLQSFCLDVNWKTAGRQSSIAAQRHAAEAIGCQAMSTGWRMLSQVCSIVTPATLFGGSALCLPVNTMGANSARWGDPACSGCGAEPESNRAWMEQMDRALADPRDGMLNNDYREAA